MATKKSKNPMEFKVEYSGIPVECGGTGVKYFRKYAHAVEFYRSKCKERKGTPGHIVKLYDNIQNKVIAQYDTSDKSNNIRIKKSIPNNKQTKRRMLYQVDVKDVGDDPRFYTYRYFYKYSSAVNFYNEMAELESVSEVILINRETGNYVLHYIKPEDVTCKIICGIPDETDIPEPTFGSKICDVFKIIFNKMKRGN